MLDVENHPRPADPASLAQWELDVMDGTLVPEFRQVQVGWYDEKIEIEQIEVTNFSEPTPTFLEYERVKGSFPKYEEQLFWVRNPDLPKERPPDPGRYGNRKRTASTGPK